MLVCQCLIHPCGIRVELRALPSARGNSGMGTFTQISSALSFPFLRDTVLALTDPGAQDRFLSGQECHIFLVLFSNLLLGDGARAGCKPPTRSGSTRSSEKQEPTLHENLMKKKKEFKEPRSCHIIVKECRVLEMTQMSNFHLENPVESVTHDVTTHQHRHF